MQEPGRQEGGSRNWMEKMKLKIMEEAQGATFSIAPSSQRLDQVTDAECPSIFMPRQRLVAVAVAPPPVPMAVPMASQTPPMDRTGAAASNSRRSTCVNVTVAAVGPYHHHHQSESRPPLITRAKKCAIVEFLSSPVFGLDTVAFLGWAREQDGRARGCYERGSCTLVPKKLAEMLLLDGCLVLFAVFLLRKSSAREHQRPYPERLEGCISLSDSMTPRGITRLAQDFINLSADISLNMKRTKLDLLLLGNQIPFFVLQQLHRQLECTFFQGIRPSIQELALSCFEDIRPSPNPCRSFPPTVHHLLHLFHWSRVPQGKHAVDPSSPLLGDPESNLHCATWFEESRIGLGTHAAAPGTLHMAFQRDMLGARGVLRVPALHIHDYSGLVFHNLIAFEQSHLRCGLAVTTYSICMAGLLQSEADAKLLRKSGILAHTHETDGGIVDLFKGLADEFRRDAFYSKDLLDLCKQVEAHHHSTAARAAKWVARQCFPKQTITFFVILGALISIATLINIVVSVYRFYHPYKY